MKAPKYLELAWEHQEAFGTPSLASYSYLLLEPLDGASVLLYRRGHCLMGTPLLKPLIPQTIANVKSKAPETFVPQKVLQSHHEYRKEDQIETTFAFSFDGSERCK